MRFNSVRGSLDGDIGVQGEDVIFRGAVDVLPHDMATEFTSSDEDDVFG